MIAVLGGLGAAGAWAVTTMCYSRATRTTTPTSVLAVAMLVGLVITGPIVVVDGIPEALDGEALALLGLAGAANIAGLLFVVSALRIGKVGIVAPIVSTEGAIAAVLAVIAGESIEPGAGATLGVIVVGIALASVSRADLDVAERSRDPARAVLLAMAGALSFGTSLYATGRVSDELPLIWPLLPARVIGVIVIAIPLVASRKLQVTRDSLPFVVVAGITEVVGFAFFAFGARDGIAVAAVLASQFGVVAAIAAYFLFGERLTRPQRAGIAAIAVGVAAISWIQA